MHQFLPKGAVIKRVTKAKHSTVDKGWGRIPYPPPQPKPYVSPIPYALLKAKAPLGRAPRLPKKPVSMISNKHGYYSRPREGGQGIYYVPRLHVAPNYPRAKRTGKAHLESFSGRMPPLPVLSPRRKMPHRQYYATGATHKAGRRKIPACVLYKGTPHKVYVTPTGRAFVKTYHKAANGRRSVARHAIHGPRTATKARLGKYF